MQANDRVQELRSYLTGAFPLRSISVNIALQSYTLFTADSLDTLIDRLTADEFNKDERLPYWAELWHSAVALAGVLQETAADYAGLEAMEIGCGLGLPGIVAAQYGIRMTFSDYDSYALSAAELNFLTNFPGGKADFLAMDFRHAPSRCWPLIIAADVIYEKRFIQPLAEFLDAALAAGGRILLAEPNRLIAVPFFDALIGRGFHYSRRNLYPVLYGRKAEISLYTIQRRGESDVSLA